jgi:shikimate dehydrogenase
MTRIAALIGDPVDHSLSPVMHNAAFTALGIDARYDLWPTALETLTDRVNGIRDSDMLGVNVTVPHKQAVFDLVDATTDIATRLGAVNTIIPMGNGLLGDNTDAYGFRKSVEEAVGRLPGRPVLVIGAGGASRAVLVALEEMGSSETILANRTRQRADDLVRELSLASTRVIDLDDIPQELASVGTIINATSIGWHDDASPVSDADARHLPDDAVAIDLTYRDTPFLRTARGRGLRAIDGLGMLIHQGARSFALWTGKEPPISVMRSAVLAEQARRSTA